MNRRKVLKAFLAAPFVAAGGSAVAVERPDGLTMAPTTPNEMTFDSEPDFFYEGSSSLVPNKAEGQRVDYDPDNLYSDDYEDKYWEAQAHINELYDDQ
jgi:hypothetical protein